MKKVIELFSLAKLFKSSKVGIIAGAMVEEGKTRTQRFVSCDSVVFMR